MIFLNKKNCGTPNESLEYTLTSLGENLVSTEKSTGSLIMKFWSELFNNSIFSLIDKQYFSSGT